MRDDDDFAKRNRMDYPAGEPMNDPLIRGRRGDLWTIAFALAALACVFVVTMVYWSENSRTASNTSPNVTTGQSTGSPSKPSPAKGAGESSSTR